MATFTSKFNVGDKVFMINDELELSDPEDSSELFGEAVDLISVGVVNRIEFSAGDPVYIIGESRRIKEGELFSSMEEAYIKIMTNLKNKLHELYITTETVLNNTKDNFEQALAEERKKYL